MYNAFPSFNDSPASAQASSPLVRGFAAAASPAARAKLSSSPASRAGAAEALALACLQPTAAGFNPAAACALAARLDLELEKECSAEAAMARELERINRAAFAKLEGLK